MKELQQLVLAGERDLADDMKVSVRTVADKVHQLKSHANITLVNDALRLWHSVLQDKSSVPLADLNAVSCVCAWVCVRVCVCLRAPICMGEWVCVCVCMCLCVLY